jgi:hypothetical protein
MVKEEIGRLDLDKRLIQNADGSLAINLNSTTTVAAPPLVAAMSTDQSTSHFDDPDAMGPSECGLHSDNEANDCLNSQSFECDSFS